jgi:hypothetical protein
MKLGVNRDRQITELEQARLHQLPPSPGYRRDRDQPAAR